MFLETPVDRNCATLSIGKFNASGYKSVGCEFKPNQRLSFPPLASHFTLVDHTESLMVDGHLW